MKKHIGGIDQLTEQERPSHKMYTQYGLMMYKDWLVKERDRINRARGRQVFIKKYDNGTMSLCENRRPDGTPRWVVAGNYKDCFKWKRPS